MPSTAIERFSYDESARELHVTFVGGATYTYYDVPKQVYAAFARSKGQHVNAYVKNRYDFRRAA